MKYPNSGQLGILFGARVKERRNSLGLTREELAEKADISPQNLAKIEAGQRFVTLATLSSLAKSLSCKPFELFQPADDASPSLAGHRKLDQLLKHRTEKQLNFAHDILTRIFKEVD